MTLKLGYNSTDSAVAGDDEGHLIEGRGWGPVDTTSAAGKAALANGVSAVKEDDIGEDSNPAAVAALAALNERRERLEAAKALDKDVLEERLEAAEVEVPDGATKTELAAAAASDTDVDLDKPRGRRGGSSK